MPKVILYHNPRCSKSRQALALLRAKAITLEVIEYLKTPPTAAQLKKIIQLLKIKPYALLRQKEILYSTLNLATQQGNDDFLIDVMIKHPILIERPIVICGDKAVIARPVEKIEEIIPACQ